MTSNHSQSPDFCFVFHPLSYSKTIFRSTIKKPFQAFLCFTSEYPRHPGGSFHIACPQAKGYQPSKNFFISFVYTSPMIPCVISLLYLGSRGPLKGLFKVGAPVGAFVGAPRSQALVLCRVFLFLS